MNRRLIGERFTQYGAVWIAAFVLTFAIAAVSTFAMHRPLIPLADPLLVVAFAVLSLIMAGFLIWTLLSREGVGTRLVLLVLALLLLLPLLWAPVLGVVATAGLAHTPIEYSKAYATFRIDVARLIFPISSRLLGDSFGNLAWHVFQGLATLVGLISGLAQIWPLLRKATAEPKSAEA